MMNQQHQQYSQHQMAAPSLLPPPLLKALDHLVDRLNASSGFDAAKQSSGGGGASPAPPQLPPIRVLLVGTNEGVNLSRSFGSTSLPSATATTTSPSPPTTASSAALPMSEEVLTLIETVWATLPSACPPHVMATAAAQAAQAQQQQKNQMGGGGGSTGVEGTNNKSQEGGGGGGDSEKEKVCHHQPPHPLLRHLGMGDEVRSATVFYENCTVLQVHMAPLVVTILAAPNANVGSMRSVAMPILKQLLEPVKSAMLASRHDAANAAAAAAAAAAAMPNHHHHPMHHHHSNHLMSGYYHTS